jgi:hypothetical protein
MYQIDNSTAVAAIPAPTAAGQPGYFTDGNPATGVSATILPAEFMNMIMMENLSVLAVAGITPAKGQYNQLALSISKIISDGAAGAASETVAGILKLSTNLQVLAGTNDSTAVTPLKLAQKLENYLGQATESAFGWLKIASQTLVNAGVDDAAAVTSKKLSAATQFQAFTAFAAGGTAPAFTLTPVPAITAYIPNQRFQVTFGAAGGATPTLNVSGIGPKNLKQYNSAGAKVAAIIAAGQTGDVFYDGTDLVLLATGMPFGTGGVGATANTPTAADLNAVGYGGMWSVAGSANSPFANGMVLHGVYNGSQSWTQIGTSLDNVGMFWRGSINGTINAWKQVWDSSNFTPSTKISGNSCPAAGFASTDKTQPYMLHTDSTVVSLSRRNTAQLAASGWSKNTDTGEIIQWVEYSVGNAWNNPLVKAVVWPTVFPNGFLNATLTFKQSSSSFLASTTPNYANATVSGCNVFIAQWQTGQDPTLTLVVTARGY